MDDSIDFQPYLSSICHDYAEWRELYTPADMEGKSASSSDQNKRAAPFDFGLMMQSIKTRKPETLPQERTEQLERRPVVAGLRKSLIEAKHILLIGRPGSGKSTALARLLLEEAQHTQGDVEEKRIPVLVELRSYKTSVLDLIQDFFTRHDLILEIHQVKTLLSQNCLLLLVDGLNELPSETARQDIVKLRNYRHVPMIFTTRDLSLGGDFGIEKQWEMLPLAERQMKEFIRSHLSPEQADAMWRQLEGRTRKFAETPLLLWMLCELFGRVQEIPHNLGEVFRIFIRTYENNSIRKHEVATLKGDVQPLSDRRLWLPALKHLAYLMMQGETPVDSRTVISREEVEEELQALFSEEPYPNKTARDCLDDLLKYHLLQIRSGNEIEFRHQLFQEYYAAEWLFQRLSNKTDEQRLSNLTDEQLKYYFLNYLKWTEAIALLIGFFDNEAKALHLVNLGWDVDWMLGARLASEVSPEFQAKTVEQVGALEVPLWLKIELWERTRSNEGDYAIFNLVTLYISNHNMNFEDSQTNLILRGALALGKNGNRTILLDLLAALSKSSLDRFCLTTCLIYITEALGDEEFLPFLIYKFEEIDTILQTVESSSKVIILDGDNRELGDEDVRMFIKVMKKLLELITKALGKFPSEHSVWTLLKSFKYSDAAIRLAAVDSLGAIGLEQTFPVLTKVLEDLEPDVKKLVVQELPAVQPKPKEFVYELLAALLAALEDENRSVSQAALRSLVKIFGKFFIGKKEVRSIPTIKEVDSIVPDTLRTIRPEESDRLLDALDDNREGLSEAAATLLQHIGEPHHLEKLWKKCMQLDLPSLGAAITAIQSRYKFYNYEIASSEPPPPINSEKLSANGSPTYIFQAPVGNVAHTVYGNQITNQR